MFVLTCGGCADAKGVRWQRNGSVGKISFFTFINPNGASKNCSFSSIRVFIFVCVRVYRHVQPQNPVKHFVGHALPEGAVAVHGDCVSRQETIQDHHHHQRLDLENIAGDCCMSAKKTFLCVQVRIIFSRTPRFIKPIPLMLAHLLRC